MFASACCFCGGLVLSSLGVSLHNIWLLYLGYGVVGGIGLGLGYIAPVSTLVKWFPDRPGMATGLAIMGFGGGALIGAPLGVELMGYFKSADLGRGEGSVPGDGLRLLRLHDVRRVHLPRARTRVATGGIRSPRDAEEARHARGRLRGRAWKTPQFWLLWAVLCLNVTAGIGILGQASLMCQDMFGVSAAVGGGFAGLLSLFNMAGRLFWSSTSDLTGRKAIYCVFFLLGAVLYSLVPDGPEVSQRDPLRRRHRSDHLDVRRGVRNDPRLPPRPLRHHAPGRDPRPPDHRVVDGRGPRPAVGQLRLDLPDRARRCRGPRRTMLTMYLMAGLLLVGLVCNLLVRPVDERFHHREAALSQSPPVKI